jgi:hypothetical protein
VRNKRGGATGDGAPRNTRQIENDPSFTISPAKTQAFPTIDNAVDAPTLQVTYGITGDLPDGRPWPPDGADFWSIVTRVCGFTRWRRIFLETTPKQSGAVTLADGLQRNKRREEIEMANARKYAGSPFISLKDLKDKPPLLEKIAFVTEEIGGKFGDRLVATFESGKRLSLNATSVGNLIDISQNFDDWTGCDVKIYAGEVSFKAGKADAVLVEPINKPAPTAAPPPAGKKSGGDMDDEIPF